jgi:NAD(P)-dependent dehydrogenase (short-subunit alcohol dehydrogenase family)
MSPAIFDLTGRVALVTGGHRGLGYAMAHALAEAGANLVLASRDEDAMHRAAETIESATGATVFVIPCDLSERGQAETLLAAAEECAGHVDILLNNAGVSIPEPVALVADSVWDETIAVNLTAAMELTRAAVPAMTERGWGRIIHISSTFGEVSAPMRASYSASKAGLRGLARASALDLGQHGITVNCIAPGPFATDMSARTTQGAARQAYADMTALGRWGEPRELGGPVLLLASDAGSYITGTTLFVDGGYTSR